MPITYLSLKQFADIINAKIQQEIPEIDPTVFGSWQRGFSRGVAAACEALSFNIRDLEKQLFPQTASDEYLERWGEYEDIPRPAATQSEGLVNYGGTLTTIVPIGTLFNNSNGFQYESTATVAIQNNVGIISSLVRSGSLVTATTSEDHGLASGDCDVVGANETDYNGTQEITVIARNKFTYNIGTTPTTPATGTISFLSVHASVNLQSVDSGADTNVEKDGAFTIDSSTPVTGVNDTGYAQYDGVSGGADQMDDEDYRQLILNSRTAIAGVFTVESIRESVFEIAGNTRVWIKRPETSGAGGATDPEPGEVSVFFVRDGDANLIPTPTVVVRTKEQIITDSGLPANTPLDALFVQGPTPVDVDVTFSSIYPDTSTMRSAIDAKIDAFFIDTVDFEVNVSLDSLRGSIAQTVDPENNQQLSSFTISSPVSDVVIAAGEIGVKGVITF